MYHTAVGYMGNKPTKGHDTDTGNDLISSGEVILSPNETEVLSTGLRISLPKGYGAVIRGRSSMSKKGLLVHQGTIDEGYTGELGICITNLTGAPVKIEAGDRIAQIVLERRTDVSWILTDSLGKTERGDNGFGSTGVK